ncbi:MULTISPECIES: hypothetical protein [unclassified Lysobacter]|uniref:hypothetical protein n=1 Tax=unclassified Lysobacter TaxID=2635362 RepID=UPI001BEA0398|nr:MULTISPECIES: hypothetical protein [unclassified Lysobacter]MBT2748583.1 hypothetical protein [Lysobacter sp. ISL-42]MBT2751518.1 hypothetical protein [Lysobacter sp. ISL-50]MBT2775712.1 hypothetical protein [Lysobacter sp. ISL-54]MBT2782323.1 hypothetical protein [Lysobacter sp. ISL-52]
MTLHVHHKFYLPGRKPWQYSHDTCETICAGCHAQEHGIIAPSHGWMYEGWEDLGELSGTCECCGTGIRYVFLVSHPAWRPLEVGTHCCDRLTNEPAASEFIRERRLDLEKKKRFISSSKWISAEAGRETRHVKDIRMSIVRKDDYHIIVINGNRGRLKFASAAEAKGKIFELLESNRLKRYLAKQHLREAITQKR